MVFGLTNVFALSILIFQGEYLQKIKNITQSMAKTNEYEHKLYNLWLEKPVNINNVFKRVINQCSRYLSVRVAYIKRSQRHSAAVSLKLKPPAAPRASLSFRLMRRVDASVPAGRICLPLYQEANVYQPI